MKVLSVDIQQLAQYLLRYNGDIQVVKNLFGV